MFSGQTHVLEKIIFGLKKINKRRNEWKAHPMTTGKYLLRQTPCMLNKVPARIPGIIC
jgi:hypothetical protein